MKEEIELRLAKIEEAELIHQMKYEAFLPLYEKYHDDETSPVKEKIEKVVGQINEQKSEYYLICWEGKSIGAVRVMRKKRKKQIEKETEIESEIEYDQSTKYISPFFILPAYQNRGMGQKVLLKLFELYEDTLTWKLDTIKQEKGNCHLYEKCGFVQIGDEHSVNDSMTLIDYERSNVIVRRFKEEDAVKISALIIRNFMEVNSEDYGVQAMEKLADSYDANKVKQIASYAHMYVFEWKEQIVGVGAISSYWGSLTESILLTIFVQPELQGRGIGRKIICTLESDELFMRANRIEIPASITAMDFYRKLGYDYKNGVKELDGEGHYRLEKFRRERGQ